MRTLNELRGAKGLYVRCPACDRSFSVQRARLFDATKPLPDYATESLQTERAAIGEEKTALRQERDRLSRRSFTSAATGGVGQVLEMLAASLPGLPANAQDCRAMLKPVDYIAFSGASKGKVEQILFIEAKTGQRRLSSVQRAIKAAVEQGAVTLRVANHLLPTE
jgi:predicted Holliday junction resolvase-like endonuclease